MGHIFHITSRRAWQQQRESGEYRHPTLDTEGFIHCSDGAQLEATWERFFGSEPGLIALDIDTERLTSEVRYEQGDTGEMFPHVYGPVNSDAVVGIQDLPA